jgi:hypothetical protein
LASLISSGVFSDGSSIGIESSQFRLVLSLMRYCPNCGIPVEGMKFCPQCGQRLTAFDLQEKQRYVRQPEILLKEKNWFERHLNWTMFLALVGAYAVSFIIGFIIALSDLYVSEGVLYIVGIIVACAILGPSWGWALRRKNRSLWWISLGLFVPFGWIVLLCLENKSFSHDASVNSIADYNKTIELNPDNADAYLERAGGYVEIGHYSQAIADYTKAIELDSSHALAYFNRAYAYGEIGEYDKAITDYSKAIELNPSDAQAYYNRGLDYNNKGEVPKAVSDLDKCIELSTDPELIKDAQQALYEIKNSP